MSGTYILEESDAFIFRVKHGMGAASCSVTSTDLNETKRCHFSRRCEYSSNVS